MKHVIGCIDCPATYDEDEIIYQCKKCGGVLEVRYDLSALAKSIRHEEWLERPLNVWRYKELLPIRQPAKAVTLHEGGTSLQRCTRLGRELKRRPIFVKNEGENPTGSFKDRGMTVGVSKAMEIGASTVTCASTGNTSASLAAYAAKAGLQSIVLIPSGKIALGKLTQAVAHGAKIIQVKGNFDAALKIAMNFTATHREIYLLNSINPYRIEGQKTLAYELFDQLGNKGPESVILPVGNAGNISAIWKGFLDLHGLGLLDRLPRMIGVQAENASPIATAFKLQNEAVQPIDDPETIATAIRIGSPVSWKKALNAVHNSKGLMETVSDEEILEGQRLLARLEGIFIEPASAASIAGLKKLIEMGYVDRDEEVVCVATGHGLKDPDIVLATYEKPMEFDPARESIESIFVG